MFNNRITAGRELASALKAYEKEDSIVLAIPRGGVPVAYEVARELGMPLSLALTKKIGHPDNKEYAIGAVSLTDSYVIPHPGVSPAYVNSAIAHIRARLQEMKRIYLGDRSPESLEGKTLIVVDDGIATGQTLLVTIRMLRKAHPARIIIAAPVASREAYIKLSEEADKVICLLIPEIFRGVGAYYEDFNQLTNQDVIYYLGQLPDQTHLK